MIYTNPAGKANILVDHLNDTQTEQDIIYVCLSGPTVIECRIEVDGELASVIYAGGVCGVFQWSAPTSGGNKFLGRPLSPGARLIMRTSGCCALRLQWDFESAQ